MKVRKNTTIARYAFFIFFFVGFQLFGAHPFYVSICEMDYNSETKGLEISLRIFTSDLEKSLQDRYPCKINLGENNESPKTDSILQAYVFQELRLNVNDKRTSFQFVGKEVDNELTWIYFEAKDIPDFDKISIHNRILIQSFPNQTNLIHVNNRKEIKSLLLTKNNSFGELTWDKK